MRDYEPLPLEATAPLLDAVQEPVRRIHDLLDEMEQHARDGNLGEAVDALWKVTTEARQAREALWRVR